MLAEVSVTLARLGGVTVRALALDGAPKQFASGCSFSRGD